jgi:hypothetical protein
VRLDGCQLFTNFYAESAIDEHQRTPEVLAPMRRFETISSRRQGAQRLRAARTMQNRPTSIEAGGTNPVRGCFATVGATAVGRIWRLRRLGNFGNKANASAAAPKAIPAASMTANAICPA